MIHTFIYNRSLSYVDTVNLWMLCILSPTSWCWFNLLRQYQYSRWILKKFKQRVCGCLSVYVCLCVPMCVYVTVENRVICIQGDGINHIDWNHVHHHYHPSFLRKIVHLIYLSVLGNWRHHIFYMPVLLLSNNWQSSSVYGIPGIGMYQSIDICVFHQSSCLGFHNHSYRYSPMMMMMMLMFYHIYVRGI